MRDLQRLEELSSIAALGLWADDVVLALNRLATSKTPDAGDTELIEEAADVLDAARRRTEEPLSSPGSARALAATETALTAVASLAHKHGDGNSSEVLEQIAELLRRAARGELHDNAEALEPATRLFGRVGELQLVASNSVLTSRKGSRAWMATQTISNFL